MNTIVTSREELLAASRKIVEEQGIQALNMRAVAAAANVAVGSVYNYFPSKAELVSATVGDIWRDVFHAAGDCAGFSDFASCVEWLFRSIRTGAGKYPGFLSAHMTGFAAQDREKARRQMDRAFGHIRSNLEQVLARDTSVRADAFGAELSREAFVKFVFANLLTCLSQEEESIQILMAVIRRVLY